MADGGELRPDDNGAADADVSEVIEEDEERGCATTGPFDTTVTRCPGCSVPRRIRVPRPARSRSAGSAVRADTDYNYGCERGCGSEDDAASCDDDGNSGARRRPAAANRLCGPPGRAS